MNIGMFDSGVGGLTVFRAVTERLPTEKIVYFGDTARHPYGEKSAETLLRFSIENSIFLMDHQIKLLVVACNTAASVGVERLRKVFNIPVIGVIEPGAKKAVEVSKTGKIAVMATKATIASKAYQKEILQRKPEAEVLPLACPLLAQLVEEGMQRHPATRLILQEYLKPLNGCEIDTILLGCTHYPPLKDLIREEVGNQIQIVDSATTCAEAIAWALSEKSLHSPSKEPVSHQFFVSDNPEKFKLIGEKFLLKPLPQVELAELFRS